MTHLTRLILIFLTVLNFFSCSKDPAPTEPQPVAPHWSNPVFLNEQFENRFSPSISGDGNTIFFDGFAGDYHIYSSTKNGEEWSAPEELPFAGFYNPCISFDGTTLFLCRSGSIYTSIKEGDVWSAPQQILFGTDVSVTQDGKTLFHSVLGVGNKSGIYIAYFEEGQWNRRGVMTEVNELGDVSEPGISGDGNLLFFTVTDRDTCTIFYTEKINDQWKTPEKLNEQINFCRRNTTPSVSWDKQKLYFSTNGIGQSKAGIYVSSWIK